MSKRTMKNQSSGKTDSSSSTSMTRRTALALAGGLGAAGMMSQSAASQKGGKPDPAFEYKQVVGEENWMYDTIQAAHDDASDGGHIYVTPSYDANDEDFPVVLRNHVRVTGGHRGADATTIDARGSGENVFEIREGEGGPDSGPSAEYTHTHTIEHLRILGGEIGVVNMGGTSATIQNLLITGTNSHGVAGLKPNDNIHVSFMNYINNVVVYGCGGNGFHFPFDPPLNYVTRLQYCVAFRNSGIGANVGGLTSSIVGGVYQNNGHHGVRFDKWGANHYLQNAYVGGNGDERETEEDHEYSANIQIDRSHAVVDNCTIRGHDVGGETERGVDIHGAGWGAEVKNCLFFNGNHLEGAFYIDEDSENVDLHLDTHIDQGEPQFIIEDNGHATRSNGTILPTDLSEVDGASFHDVAFDDGSSTESGNPAFALWQDDKWHMVELQES